MKIIYGITKSNFGGAQRYVFDLALGAKNFGHEVAVLCGGEGMLVKKLKEQNIRVIPLPELDRDISFIKDFKSFMFILKTLREERPDVFHTNSSKMGGIGNFAARIARVRKIIFTGHGWAFNEKRSWLSKIIIRDLVWYTVLLSHKTICVSEKTKEAIAWEPFIKNKLVVIYNGIENFELISRTDTSFIVGTIAELHKIKGLDVLLNAWKEFIQNKQAKLVIIGEGEERKSLEKLVSDLKINDSVVFNGFVNNARSQLSTFDIFVLPSRSEAMPYALLEAGFAGLPVTATNVGGVSEVIENNKNGLLVDKENPKQITEALNKLFNDKNLHETLGTNLKQTISTKFSIFKMLESTFVLYK
ncbi:MAG: glycosyltransferase family 4 protein [Minisyncoccia bacterium]